MATIYTDKAQIRWAEAKRKRDESDNELRKLFSLLAEHARQLDVMAGKIDTIRYRQIDVKTKEELMEIAHKLRDIGERINVGYF